MKRVLFSLFLVWHVEYFHQREPSFYTKKEQGKYSELFKPAYQQAYDRLNALEKEEKVSGWNIQPVRCDSNDEVFLAWAEDNGRTKY